MNVGRPAVGLGSRMFSIPAFTTGAYGKVYAIHWGISVPGERIGVVCQGFYVFRTVTSFRVFERAEAFDRQNCAVWKNAFYFSKGRGSDANDRSEKNNAIKIDKEILSGV